jgi:hypothetical protein
MPPRRKLWSKFNVYPKVIYGNAACVSFIKVVIHYLRCSFRVLKEREFFKTSKKKAFWCTTELYNEVMHC